MDKLYDKVKDNSLDYNSLEYQEFIAKRAGEDLRELILKNTGLDTHELTKNYGK